ncbi:MAG: helix-turn-helix domain-containing protein, partial [Mariprofundaceae bacterium]
GDNKSLHRAGGRRNKKQNSVMWRYCKGKPEKVFNDIKDGMSLADIGNHVGISKQAVYQWLMRQDVKHREIIADMINGWTMDILADSSIDVARARAMAQHNQFTLERRFHKNYGRSDKLEVSGTIEVASKLQAARKRLADKGYIDAEVVGDSEEG